MKQRTISRIFSFILIASLIFSLNPERAQAVTQEEIDAARAERIAIAEEHDQKQAEIDELEDQKASVLERKLAMDERNELTRKEIESIENEIQVYNEMIAEEKIKLEQAEFVEEQQLERYRTHVRAMEENGELGILALVLRADNLSDLLTSIDDASRIMHRDRELHDDYIAAREYTQQVKANYEQVRAELEETMADLQDQKAALEEEIAEAAKMIEDLENDIEAREAEAHELLLAEIEAADKLDKLIAERERERAEEELHGSFLDWYYATYTDSKKVLADKTAPA